MGLLETSTLTGQSDFLFELDPEPLKGATTAYAEIPYSRDLCDR